jgi:uncharacterized protein (DUF427 family)
MQPTRIEPEPGQESVWDYPRPPTVEATSAHLRVVHRGRVLAETRSALRVLETSQPPVFYFEPLDVDLDLLERSASRTFCEWKGFAGYWSLRAPDASVDDVAWSYESPTPPYAALAGRLAFYPQRVEECWVDGERVRPNPGSFYGGWITSRVVGPFKGDPGTEHW